MSSKFYLSQIPNKSSMNNNKEWTVDQPDHKRGSLGTIDRDMGNENTLLNKL